MRDLAIRGGPFADAERAALLDYCQTDADALARLLPLMLPRLDLPRAVGCAGGTRPRRRGWSGPGCRSTRRRSPGCGVAGTG